MASVMSIMAMVLMGVFLGIFQTILTLTQSF
jgi:hypothetical protein